MLKNYLKVALRTLLKHKSFSLINILGLAVGMPVCLLIILIIDEQRRIDRFHENQNRIYRITTRANEKATRRVYDFASAPAPLSPVLKNDYAEVEDAVRLLGFSGAAKYQDKLLEIDGFYAEASYFRIFSFDLTAGNRETALQAPFSAVISPEAGKKFFGDENPLGQVLAFSFGDVRITGVHEELAPGQRSHLEADILISFSTIRALQEQKFAMADPEDWNYHTRFYHYLLLAAEDKAPAVEAAFPEIIKRFYREDSPFEYAFSLQPLTGIALGPELVNQIGQVMEGTVLYIFLIVAFVVMVPAIFNYMSLTVARSLKRAKEIGVRKVVGAQRLQIIGQILCESIVVAMLALVPAVALLDLLLPLFNGFDFVEYLAVNWKTDWRVYAFFLMFSLGAGLLAGLFPAIFLSTMRPAQVLKGLSRIRGFSGLTVRKIFLVIQFALSLFFIINTTLFYRQFKFMLNADYGFDKERVVSVYLQDVPYDLLRNELLRHADIAGVSATSHLIGRANVLPHLPIRSDNLSEPIKAVNFYISENHLENLDFVLLAGRNFSNRFATDSTQAVILNETAMRRLGFGDARTAVGQVITVGENAGPVGRPSNGASMQIIGVVQDFHYARLQNSIEPVVLRYAPAKFTFAMVRVAPGDMTKAMSVIEASWQKLSVNLQPLHYQFLDEFILGAYNDMRDIILFLGIIAGLAIFIACLGLLGMAIFSAETRVKEIGIRKVFGASAAKIALLLSQDLVKLLAFAVLLVTPLLFAFINFMFLENVAFRITLGPEIFIPGLALVALLAFMTIASQTLKAARANPVEALRYE
jgi:putative ABC transport system permease protein